jgi:hypothetical protein
MSNPERCTLRDCWHFDGELHLRLDAHGEERHIILPLTPNDLDDLHDALVGIELEAGSTGEAAGNPPNGA